MSHAPNDDLSNTYPQTWVRIPAKARSQLRSLCANPGDLPHFLDTLMEEYCLPQYLPEMAELEAAVLECRRSATRMDKHPNTLGLNPSLSMFQLQFVGLLDLLNSGQDPKADPQEDSLSGEAGTGLLWWDPFREKVRLEPARNEDLLVLKIVAEELDVREIGEQQGITPSRLYTLIQRAKNKGLVLGPASRLQRPREVVSGKSSRFEEHQTAEVFTLQWHLTDACDMHCRHCYGGGTARQHVEKEEAFRVLQDTARFCRQKNVRGQITFTGGNPIMHPDFFQIYEAAVQEGFLVAILGNPTDAETLERLVAIEPPVLFQVSLEGMREHNDHIRQEGHFDRVLEFLDLLREHGVPSQVMLTLTRANIEQVLPLAEVLRGRADRFTFNRISLVGEGASLRPPDMESYQSFLQEYLEATRTNPILRLKDNLLNPALAARGEKPFGGCTGYGCGAAFNFLALLPNGAVHACRKFPSPLGDIHTNNLSGIYDSSIAAAYRSAPQECLDCSLAPVCRGCLAVVHSWGKDVFRERDPYCSAKF